MLINMSNAHAACKVAVHNMSISNKPVINIFTAKLLRKVINILCTA